jgi:ureidoglycolate dehydrogenase (NAD+)
MTKNYLVCCAELRQLVTEIFTAHDLQVRDAEMMSDMMINANLRGVFGHGVLRVSNYINRLSAGGMKKHSEHKIVVETPSTAVIEGNDGFGAVVLAYGAELAREKADKNNIAMVVVRNTEHSGTLANWSLKIAQDDMIGITGTAAQPIMPPVGGKSIAVGNNPFSVTIPCGDKNAPICVDMSCGVVSGGRIFDLKLKDMPMPEGWALDKDGNPTIDPNLADIFLPFSGHKGYAIAVAVECLGSMLSGGAFGTGHGHQYGKLAEPNRVHTFFIAIKISAFRDLAGFKRDVDAYIETLHSAKKIDGVDKIWYPGEMEAAHQKKALAEGIELNEELVNELIDYALHANISAEKTEFLKRKPI